MPDSTYEEATRCPKCGNVGRLTANRPAPRNAGGGRVHIFTCETEACRWYDTTYLVQVRADGTVPNRETDRPGVKVYPAMSPYQEAVARQTLEEAELQLLRDAEKNK